MPLVATFRAVQNFFRYLLLLAVVGAQALRAAEPAVTDGYENVGFDRLASFDYTPPVAETIAPVS